MADIGLLMKKGDFLLTLLPFFITLRELNYENLNVKYLLTKIYRQKS